jgi:hypothetical protein
MSKVNQTAGEWLVEQLTPSISLQQKHIDKIKILALEMEKEQIFNAFEHVDFNLDNGLHYYNETYEAQEK